VDLFNSEFVIRNFGIAYGDDISKTFTETTQGERTTFALCCFISKFFKFVREADNRNSELEIEPTFLIKKNPPHQCGGEAETYPINHVVRRKTIAMKMNDQS